MAGRLFCRVAGIPVTTEMVYSVDSCPAFAESTVMADQTWYSKPHGLRSAITVWVDSDNPNEAMTHAHWCAVAGTIQYLMDAGQFSYMEYVEEDGEDPSNYQWPASEILRHWNEVDASF